LGVATNNSNQEVATALVRAAARTTHTFLGEVRGKTVKNTLSLWSMVKGGGGSPIGVTACGGGGGGQRRWVAAL
jgi:hypothetical protein